MCGPIVVLIVFFTLPSVSACLGVVPIVVLITSNVTLCGPIVLLIVSFTLLAWSYSCPDIVSFTLLAWSYVCPDNMFHSACLVPMVGVYVSLVHMIVLIVCFILSAWSLIVVLIVSSVSLCLTHNSLHTFPGSLRESEPEDLKFTFYIVANTTMKYYCVK